MIVVTGATGHLGRLIVERLLDRVPAADIGVSVRNSSKAADLAARGVRVRHGDFDDPASLRDAFEGADQLLMVSSNARASGGDPLAQHRRAIDAAKAVGVGRIVYTSHMAASASSAFPPMLDHAATEAMLQDAGLAWTALRHGFYADSAFMFMGDGLQSRTITAPADGKVAWTAHDDLAETAAAVLIGATPIDGPTPPLTGAEALDLADLAAIASEVQGRTVIRDTVSDDAMRARMAERGTPSGAIPIALGFYQASRNGEFATVDSTLEGLIGRRPISMRDLIAAEVS